MKIAENLADEGDVVHESDTGYGVIPQRSSAAASLERKQALAAQFVEE